ERPRCQRKDRLQDHRFLSALRADRPTSNVGEIQRYGDGRTRRHFIRMPMDGRYQTRDRSGTLEGHHSQDPAFYKIGTMRQLPKTRKYQDLTLVRTRTFLYILNHSSLHALYTF